MSGPPLRVIVVEDVVDDATLLERELRRGGYELTMRRVETAAQLTAALESAEWDIIITDYALPKFNAPEALETLHKTGKDIPVIVMSGTVNEEIAIACLRGGANDFITKGKVARLLPAVERELREAKVRRERTAAVAELRASQERYRLLFDNNPLPTFLVDVGTRAFLEVNDAAVRHYGYTREELLSLRVDVLWPPGEAQGSRALHDSTPRTLTRTGPLRHMRRDGTYVESEIATQEFDLGGKRARLIVVHDVTQRRQLEEQLRQAQKMEAIGHLAGGIAHDFNNMLAVITSYAELVAEQVEDKSPIRADIEEIRGAASRATALTRQLLAFSRRQMLQPVETDLNTVVGEIEKLLRRTIGEDVTLVTELAGDLWRVKVDPTQVDQILMNLAVNARDAMPGGGTLTIRTLNVTIDDSRATAATGAVPAGSYVSLEVADTGTGMDAATQARVFEPFFTTKDVGKGTGLGLATVYGIVQQSNGHVSVTSAPGKGTTFRVLVPRVDGEEVDRAAAMRPATVQPPPMQTILLVEDDAALRTVSARILRAAGYEVLVAESARRALELSGAHDGSISVLVTDVVMPEMSGATLAAELAQRRPETPVLFLSGYSGERLNGRGMPEGAAFLEKPFTPDSLKRKIGEILVAREAQNT